MRTQATNQAFARKLKTLASEQGLETNQALGDFLGVSAERACVLKSGQHKAQFKTLRKVAEAFAVDVADFLP